MASGSAITGGGSTLCEPENPQPLGYNASNQVVSGPTVPTYDAAGDVTNDGTHQYLYNADGNICAVSETAEGVTTTTLYIYDADGNRVAKGKTTSTGAITSCDSSANGFTDSANYVQDEAGHQLSEFDGSGNWVHTNVYANNELIATYNTIGLHFRLNDWLGTLRVQTDDAGNTELSCQSLPFGDPNTQCVNASENFFTGKERDVESGNDYFGARYYASSMGRFLSPDWSATPTAVPYAKFTNPQTLNLYQYMQNNPLSGADKDGHCDWCQKLWNGIIGNGFQTNAQIAAQQQQATVTTTETYSLPANQVSESTAEPNEAVALGADTVGLASATPGVVPEIAGAIPGAPAFGLGLLATGVSVNNDPSALNLSINATSTTLGAMSTFGTGAVATVGTVGGFGVAAGALAWDGSNFVSNNVITPVFTPDANQSDTINANGVTIPAPDAYDWHQQQ